MIYYADTSWWLALKLRNDEHHEEAWTLFDRDENAKVLWTPWQRVEVFNGLYQLERIGVLDPGEAKEAVRMLEKEVQLEYWPHREFKWTEAVRMACLLTELHGRTLPIRGMDLFHVAAALTVQAEGFLTFDDDQKELAAAVGYRTETSG